MAMYADDTTLYLSAENIDQRNIILQMELNPVKKRITDNRLVINAGKQNVW